MLGWVQFMPNRQRTHRAEIGTEMSVSVTDPDGFHRPTFDCINLRIVLSHGTVSSVLGVSNMRILPNPATCSALNCHAFGSGLAVSPLPFEL
jgi:hypothetical protein